LNDAVINWINSTGHLAPWASLGIFLAGSLLMIWRLESMSANGLEGTVLGTLVMPYCSGLGNLIFAWVMGHRRWVDGALHGDLLSTGAGREVMTNCLVNNVTNMTLLIGLPAAIWGLSLAPKAAAAEGNGKKKGKAPADPHRVNRLSLLLTITAAAFFAGVMWALGRDGKLDFSDGLVLVGVFVFWQVIHVFEVLKSNAQQKHSFGFWFVIDFVLLLAGAYAVFISTDWLVNWVGSHRSGFVSAKHLGWLSGWLMVLPNALLAFYYAWRGRPEVVYSSQVGDGHICIPLCIGVFALFKPIHLPDFFQLGVWLLVGAAALHFVFVALLGRMPRLIGWLLVAAYGVFLWKGILEK
jgi:cation:H+ antiporter